MAKILLIEDDPLILRLYQKIFSLEGDDVKIAEEGAVGLKKAKEFKPDLILLDLMMPKMDGFQVLERLKADPATKDIPVVVSTNLAGQRDAKRALAKGAVRYLIKSEYDAKQIVGEVKKVLTEHTKEEAQK